MEANENKQQLIHEAVLNDIALKQLNAKRAEIYSLAVPTMVLKSDGSVETICLDETNHPLLPKINELIKHRINQIKDFFNR